jgi:hypothetical protein
MQYLFRGIGSITPIGMMMEGGGDGNEKADENHDQLKTTQIEKQPFIKSIWCGLDTLDSQEIVLKIGC